MGQRQGFLHFFWLQTLELILDVKRILGEELLKVNQTVLILKLKKDGNIKTVNNK